MDIPTIDSQYQQLQSQAQQTTTAIGTLAAKLQDAAKGGNQDAREWLLDLKEIALAMQAEQNQVGLLLQALHAFVVNQPSQQVMAPPPGQPGPWGAPPPAQPGYYPPPQQGYPPQPGGGVGGMLGSFLNSGFGRAIEMGAGFGIGDDLVKKIF